MLYTQPRAINTMKVDINLIYTVVSLGVMTFFWLKAEQLRNENKQLKQENLRLKNEIKNLKDGDPTQ